MTNKVFLSFSIILIFNLNSYSQTLKKTLKTNFCEEKITIDGKFDEEIWNTSEIATNFLMIAPDNGKLELAERKSEVKVVYNNDAIYIGATLFDNEPTKIRRELTTRDDFATADHFGVFLNGYNDGQQEFRFFVSAAGVQMDILYTDANGEDISWNAIWDSQTTITDYGWTVEMKIPYAALRFPGDKTQTWGINFYREIMRDRQQFTWNLIDNKIGSEANQAGILNGIKNIQTPTRLFLIPYSSFYVNASDFQKTKAELKGGLDIKYGINDAFTLDAILVPDFGQTAFDKVELNLGPFEQQFAENRPFFTEGTELFSKGNLVYSRRIGGEPTYSRDVIESSLPSNQEVIDYPEKVNLLNALKISGRTKSGLGIGVLNAVTEKTVAKIRDNNTGMVYEDVTEPLANYNVLVLDQRFRKNSSVSFINTNVTRNGEFRDANVSALVFDLNTKKNTYNLSGDYKYSYINENQSLTNRKGYNTSLNFGETSGKFRNSFGAQYVSDDWDNNDLGINFQTHYHALYTNSSYRILNPNKKFNNFSIFQNNYFEFDNRTGKVQESRVSFDINTTTKKNDYHGYGINGRITDVHDFYSPQSVNEEKYIIVPRNIGMYYFFSSNYNRKFALDMNPSVVFINENNRVDLSFLFSPRYRFSDKLSMVYSFQFIRQMNDVGFIDYIEETDNTIFARRNRNTFTNSISSKYSINNVMTFNLAVRYYLSYAVNHRILNLEEDGTVSDNFDYLENKNSNLNLWNLDLSYSWWFAPGSQMSILYRNNSSSFQRDVDKDFGMNFKNTLNHQILDHTFSISIRYFIDYNTTKNWFSKKK